jgi:hypothetical protein
MWPRIKSFVNTPPERGLATPTITLSGKVFTKKLNDFKRDLTILKSLIKNHNDFNGAFSYDFNAHQVPKNAR